MLIHLFNGLVHGTLLIVMCSGLALIYGLRRVVNFAHGDMYMVGGMDTKDYYEGNVTGSTQEQAEESRLAHRNPGAVL